MSVGGDLFGALPDELLSHVLSFLPSRNAVHTSLLSRRWRHLWRSAPAIHVHGEGDGFCHFVNNLLIGRESASAPPLRSFEIDANLERRVKCTYCHKTDHCTCDFISDEDRWDVNPDVDDWVTHALLVCRARSLTACFRMQVEVRWEPRRALPFASPYLTRIHLVNVHLTDGQLDFSCCPALLRLTLEYCNLYGDALVSPSLEHLTIDDCRTDVYGHLGDPPEDRLYSSLSTPRLRFLEISENYWRKLFLERMPLLPEESIQYIDDEWIRGDDDDDNNNDDDDDDDE